MAKRKYIIIGITTIIALSVLLLFIFFNNNNDVEQPAVQSASEVVEEQPKPADEPPISTKGKVLQTKIQEAITKYPGLIVGVSVNNLKNDESANINSNYDFVAASTTKVIIATYTYSQAEQGHIDLDATMIPKSDKPEEYKPVSFRDNIRYMIVNSDNESWADLMGYFGKSNIDAYTKELGFDSFTTDGNIINAKDMAGFLKAMSAKPLINQVNLTELTGFMGRSYTGPLDLNAPYQELAKKTGWLEDRLHFIGFINAGESKMSFSIYSETSVYRQYSYTNGSSMINDILDTITNNPI